MKRKLTKVYMAPHVEECVRHLHDQDLFGGSLSGLVNRLLVNALLHEHARGRLPTALLGPMRALIDGGEHNDASSSSPPPARALSASAAAEASSAQSDHGYGQACDAF